MHHDEAVQVFVVILDIMISRRVAQCAGPRMDGSGLGCGSPAAVSRGAIIYMTSAFLHISPISSCSLASYWFGTC